MRITSSRDEFSLPEITLDVQSWTRAYYLSSRVVAVTTTTENSWRLSREFHNRSITELPSRVLSRAERTLKDVL